MKKKLILTLLVVLPLAFAVIHFWPSRGGQVVEVESGRVQEHSFRWEPVPAGMILTRNFMVPRSPEKEGYRVLPDKYRLGSKAYAKAPPEWWLQMVDDAKVGELWHPKDFPLAFAGEFKAKDGRAVLLVVQVSQAFTGDGMWSSGPVVYLVARLFSKGESGPKLMTEESWTIGGSDGSFQYSRLFAGELNGRQILFQTDGGMNFNSDEVTRELNWTLSLEEDNSLRFQKSD